MLETIGTALIKTTTAAIPTIIILHKHSITVPLTHMISLSLHPTQSQSIPLSLYFWYNFSLPLMLISIGNFAHLKSFDSSGIVHN